MRNIFIIASIIIASLAVLLSDCDSSLFSRKRNSESISEKASTFRDMYYTFYISEINDSIASLYKSLGVKSVQSYVTWETCEKSGEGMWDWSRWDTVVRVLKENNLKWVPFLILGPAYSTPDWFRAGKDHFPCRCLEHGQDSKIESLWNPELPKWIDRFIKAFSDRYRDSAVIESVLLGIQGDFGEAIYSVLGGGWTFDIPGVYHNHPGYWCDDPFALDDFRSFLKQRYSTPEKLNKAWGIACPEFDHVDFPGRKDELIRFQELVQSGDPGLRRRWLDFIDWYRSAMTNWADWWIGIARKYFPDTPVYLCTGGDSRPQFGSNFAEQTRIAAKHKAGIRITNEASDYKTNFSFTDWVASAGKHYNTYYGFEPAGEENEKGIIARIYNATATGANQLFDYPGNITSSQERIDVQQAHLKYLFYVPEPIVPVALWYPNVSLALNWGGFLEKSALLRDYTNFDFIDETLLHTGALNSYKILIIIQGKVMETSDAMQIAKWIRNGGHAFVIDVPEFESVEATSEPETILFGRSGSDHWKNGKGRIRRVSDWNDLMNVLGKTMTDMGVPVCDLMKDSIFTTQIEKERWFFLNTSSKTSLIKIIYPDSTFNASISPNTITDIDLK